MQKRIRLSTFYSLPRYQNIQMRYVLGFHYYPLSRFVQLRGPFKAQALRVAKKRLLSKYEAFRLAERFKDSTCLFASKHGVNASIPERRYEKTPDRPGRDEFNSETS